MLFLFLYGRTGRTEELLKVLRLKSGMLKAKKRQEPSQARLSDLAYQLEPNCSQIVSWRWGRWPVAGRKVQPRADSGPTGVASEGPVPAQPRRPRSQSAMTASHVRREKAAFSSGCNFHLATAPAGVSTWAVMEVTKWLKPSV